MSSPLETIIEITLHDMSRKGFFKRVKKEKYSSQIFYIEMFNNKVS